jgi:protein-tyrosine-phosphatase
MSESATTTTKSLIRRALPSPVVYVIQMLRRLAPASRRVFAREWLRRLFTRSTLLPEEMPSAPRLLFVCHGNILRSAVARALYADRVHKGAAPAGSIAESAGTAAREGDPADPRGIGAARDLGLRLDGHRAGRLSEQLVERADLILVMDYLNEADVVARFPAAARKVRLLGSFLQEPGRPTEIRDPYTGSTEDVRASFQMIAQAVDSLSATLSLAGTREAGNSA